MTPSQKQAIEKQKRLMQSIHFGCEFTIYSPKSTSIVRLVCTYTLPNMLGGMIHQSQSWTIGKRGKIK